MAPIVLESGCEVNPSYVPMFTLPAAPETESESDDSALIAALGGGIVGLIVLLIIILVGSWCFISTTIGVTSLIYFIVRTKRIKLKQKSKVAVTVDIENPKANTTDASLL